MHIMFTLTIPYLSTVLLLYFTATVVAQPYKATEHFLLDCGSSSPSTSDYNQTWDGDENSKFVPSDITATSVSSNASSLDPSVDTVPYSTARIINTSSFTYTFPVSQGPKFLRLYFYPATYSNLDTSQSFFSVSSNDYSLLTNFSAFLTASYLAKTRSDAGVDGPQVPHFIKEFVIHVNDTQILNVVFTPSPNSYAFINGIEIISMPKNLYHGGHLKYVPGPILDEKMALESIYRLNVGGGQISDKDDTGMYRFWDQDDSYIYGAAYGLTHLNKILITYTTKTPSYTAPDQVYQTQRSMGNLSNLYNLTWRLPVDSGFSYMLRLHFCNIIPQYTKPGDAVFTVFINNQTVEEEVDLFRWTQGSGYPVVKDYVVLVNDPDGHKSKQDLWLAMHPNPNSKDAYLNGLEAFKLSSSGNLAGPNPELSSTSPPASPSSRVNKNKAPYGVIIGGALVLLTLL